MSKSCKKATLITVLLTVILAAAVVIGAMFGFSKGAAVGDNKSLTVSMDQIAYETELEEVKAECEKVFTEQEDGVFEKIFSLCARAVNRLAEIVKN